jgi:TFIIF-interacting CTD phosphatase-like protein
LLQPGPSSDTLLCRLYRNSTQYKDGKHVRDLSKLNRDLSNVLLITSDPDAFFLQPDNAIKVGTSVAALLLLVPDQPLPHTMQSCTLCPVL